MTPTEDTFYITTAIDYSNSAPHMGHAYEKVIADFYARAYRLRGVDTRFLIGLDEHGQKMQEAAEKRGKSPQEFVDGQADVFRNLYRFLKITNDDFVRTSEKRHHDFCQDLYRRVHDAGDIYKGFYEGDYCISCERFYTATELVDGKCPLHDRATTKVKEESYFFRMSRFRDALRTHIEEKPTFIYPEKRRNEIVARLSEELKDLSISRSTFDWGIPLPDDPNHVVYVWFDALSNYMSALRQPTDLYDRYWPADCHVIGKDISWFHAVIWPAMLLSAGYPLPHQVYVHGFINDQNGRKMSKELGNVVNPLKVIDDYSVEVLRFYFLRCFASGQDGNFSMQELEDRYNSELANELGNLILRVVKLVRTRLGGEISTPGYPADLDDATTIDDFFRWVDAREHHRAVDALWTYIKKTNAYMNEKEPWKIKEEEPLKRVLGTCIEALRTIASLVEPAMPETAANVATALGIKLPPVIDHSRQPRTYCVQATDALFPRREKEKSTPATTSLKNKKPEPTAVDPFTKLELRVGQVVEVTEHPDADALFAMKIDVGEGETRSICAGLRGHVTTEELQGRRVLVLANLKKAKLRGIESNGMVLAADRTDGKVIPVDPGKAEIGDLVTIPAIETRPKKKLSKSAFEKAPLAALDGKVSYKGKPLRSSVGFVLCDAEDGAVVR